MILPKKDLTLFQTALKVGAVYTSGGKGYVIRDLFRLVAAAKSGGEKGYAFRVAENGYTDGTRGFMIDGALPYWNIWSPDSPGRFFIDIDLYFRHKIIDGSNPTSHGGITCPFTHTIYG